MFYCPKCGEDTIVVDSRDRRLGVHRRRRCISDGCQYRFSTSEVPKETYEELAHIGKMLSRATTALHEITCTIESMVAREAEDDPL